MTAKISSEFISQQLRAIRHAQALSLHDVGKASNGAIKAVVLGSYERGTRSLSVKRAIEIADFYGVPVSALFGALNTHTAHALRPYIIDTRRLRSCLQEQHDQSDSLDLLSRLISHVQNSRQDWNGEVISIRKDDVQYLTIALNHTFESLQAWLEKQQLLLARRN